MFGIFIDFGIMMLMVLIGYGIYEYLNNSSKKVY